MAKHKIDVGDWVTLPLPVVATWEEDGTVTLDMGQRLTINADDSRIIEVTPGERPRRRGKFYDKPD